MSTGLRFLPALLCAAGVLAGCQNAQPGRPPVAAAAAGSPVDQKFLVNVDTGGIALNGGYDPVAFFTDNKPIKGDPKIRSVYRGAVYHFASAEHKAMFDADPARYEPQFGGFCAYAASVNRVSPVDVKYFEIVGGRLILQHNQKAWDLWHKSPSESLVKADTNWPGLVKANGL
ncbi:MAG: hypothetical protein IBJ11_09255 [Phycisphaerales bacterium]|nr:hypothetical protein [Phycisphaerales bacterium]